MPGANDDPRERQLKLDVVGVYNHRLNEREKWKQFVVHHDLPDSKRNTSSNKTTSKVTIYFLVKL